MTPELQARIADITCKVCAGNGSVGHGEAEQYAARVIRRRWGQTCEPCNGTGIQPDRPNVRMV
jgi:DnaJ-class molecular chaperone